MEVPAPAPVAKASQAPARATSMHVDTMMGTTSTRTADDIMASLADLDLSSGANTIQEEPLLPDVPHAEAPTHSLPTGSAEPAMQSPIQTNGQEGLKQLATLGGVAPSLLAPLTVAPNIEKVSSSDNYQRRG